MSRDRAAALAEDWRMARSDSDRRYQEEFIARTKLAREAAGFTQEQLAHMLGIDQGTYKQYERRTLLPHRLIKRFCLATGFDEKWLISNEGHGPGAVIIAPRKRRAAHKNDR